MSAEAAIRWESLKRKLRRGIPAHDAFRWADSQAPAALAAFLEQTGGEVDSLLVQPPPAETPAPAPPPQPTPPAPQPPPGD